MKKIITTISLALVLVFASCSTEEMNTSDSIQKTSVALSVTQDPTTKTDKNVKRGTIYAWVNSITVVAKNDPTTYSKTELFNLVPNSQSSGESSFVIDDVAVGATTFTATSTTDSAQKYVLANTTGAATTVLNTLKTNNPYVLYNSPEVKKVISSTVPNVINIPMNTNNGRIISVFQLEDNAQFRAGFKASITAKGDGEVITGTSTVQSNGLVYFEWSNTKSINNAKVVFTIDVTPINNSNNIHNIYTIESKVEASTSYSCVYTITKDKAPVTHVKVDNLTFSFQEFREVTCETCK